MDLTIVIVNYNVRYFLEQCLHSVDKALKQIQGEVIVIDNNSVDGSSSMVSEKFPHVTLIENKENLGFSKANNQGLKLANGKYCLLLNPDTLVEEDTFIKCIAFMDLHPEAGAMGVKMIDGKGNFLPESKRALPTPSVAFYKIFGLSSLFPHSRIFGKYHLGFLSSEETNPVDVVAGAFMFIRKEALEKTGLLDERFFMYGEDIDISYRLVKKGFKNYYFPETTIIHYKGESTKKESINYVLLFYKAMILFTRKHFKQNKIHIITLLIQLAIYFRAFLAITRRMIIKSFQPFLDIILIIAGYYFLIPWWEKYRFGTEGYYPQELYAIAIPAYILTWILSIYFSGGYRKPVRIMKIITGHLTGTMIILIIYALLPEKMRFSRAIILIGSAWGMMAILSHRLIMSLTGIKAYELELNRKKRLIIVGFKEECQRVMKLLEKNRILPEIIGLVSPSYTKSSDYIGNAGQLPEIIRIHKIDEIVFCARDISSREIINLMIKVSGFPVHIKIAPPESLFIIGSNSASSSGDFYMLNFNSVGNIRNTRNKRMFDIISSFLIIVLSPFLFLFIKNFKKILNNSLRVIFSNYTWISYFPESDITNLPKLKKGIFGPALNMFHPDPETIGKLNMEYARDYKVSKDLFILIGNIFRK